MKKQKTEKQKIVKESRKQEDNAFAVYPDLSGHPDSEAYREIQGNRKSHLSKTIRKTSN
ncbi:MAG: hypothetical protein L0Y76_03020 [Ignavibacteria bacterium]|nr:hypothetical protein [Ignavibacteria bacterium]